MKNFERIDGSTKLDGIEDNTYKLLFSDQTLLNIDEFGSNESFKALNLIEKFTMLDDKRILDIILKKFKIFDSIDFKKITYDKQRKIFIYKSKSLEIPFVRLSDDFDDEEIKEELTSKNRYHKCHIQSLILASNNPSMRIVTGYITIKNHRILHSFVEYDSNEGTIVIDWTKNIRMLKQDYCKITNFVSLSTIEGNDLLSDLENPFFAHNINVKVYCVFRNEIVENLTKNKKLFL